MRKIKVSIGGYLSGALLMAVLACLSWAIGLIFFCGLCVGGIISHLMIVFAAAFGETDESAAEIEDLKEVLNQIYFETDCSDEQKELIEDAIYMDLEKNMKVVITPVDREIVEKLQKASGLTKENAEN